MVFEKKIEEIYRKNAFKRYDDTGAVFYFSVKDFPGLKKEEYSFKGSAGQRLQGYFYYYDAPVTDRIVVFDHGLGGGHRAYLKEIERLAKHGYPVFAYDHTGCMESEGENTNGLSQSLNDLNACITELKRIDRLKGRSFSVMGHSWGAFSAMNIVALHTDITHVVALSGFISVEQMLKQNFTGILAGYRKPMWELERRSNPDYVDFNAVESLKNTHAKVLLIHSADDKTVDAKYHFNLLKTALAGKKNIRLMEVQGKGHNPNYTEEAIKYKTAFFAALQKKRKQNALNTTEEKQAFVARFDWNKITEQDDAVWEKIFDHLDH